ncbi:hypothetical protein [Acidipropionibacterium timonense]|uniref:hypothetical protein n=1 Tax=Acidipropionibacterium timonense TaxID=2161818 RepID=UPI00103260DD|nr:hypothetical protein [Acidipropionibacterium timonense]
MWTERTSWVEAPDPWELLDDGTEFGERVTRWAHPAGARLTARVSMEPTPSLRVVLKVDEGHPADDALSVPGPTWRFDLDDPVQAWPAGAVGRVVARVDEGLLVWSQIAGACRLVDTGVSLWGRTATLSDRRPLLSMWRGEIVDDLAEARAGLPAWLPESLVVEIGETVDVEDEDAGIVLDGVAMPSPAVAVPVGRHLLEVRRAPGDVLLDVGAAPTLAHQVGMRAREVVDGADPRRTRGAAAWLVVWAASRGLVGQDGLEVAVDIVENLLARPHVDFFAACAACHLGWRLDDADLWEEGGRAVAALPTDRPGAVMARALAASLALTSGREDPAGSDGRSAEAGRRTDPLVRSERALWGPGRRTPEQTRRALDAVWLLGEAVPAVDPTALVDRGGRLDIARTAWASAITAAWPPRARAFGEAVGVARGRAARRLLAADHLDDEVLALLTW